MAAGIKSYLAFGLWILSDTSDVARGEYSPEVKLNSTEKKAKSGTCEIWLTFARSNFCSENFSDSSLPHCNVSGEFAEVRRSTYVRSS